MYTAKQYERQLTPRKNTEIDIEVAYYTGFSYHCVKQKSCSQNYANDLFSFQLMNEKVYDLSVNPCLPGFHSPFEKEFGFLD